jgi:hypothetical protein
MCYKTETAAAEFDIDSAPDAEPQPAPDEAALAAFEAERQALANERDVPF